MPDLYGSTVTLPIPNYTALWHQSWPHVERAIVFVFILCCSIFVFRMNVCFCCVRLSFFSTRQKTGGEDRLRSDLFCVVWDVNFVLRPRLNVKVSQVTDCNKRVNSRIVPVCSTILTHVHNYVNTVTVDYLLSRLAKLVKIYSFFNTTSYTVCPRKNGPISIMV